MWLEQSSLRSAAQQAQSHSALEKSFAMLLTTQMLPQRQGDVNQQHDHLALEGVAGSWNSERDLLAS